GKENTSTSLHCSSVNPDSTIAPTSETTDTGNISRPIVRPEVQRHASNGNQLVFHCDFDPLSEVSTMYQVTWYKDRSVSESKLMYSTWISYISREQFRSLTDLPEAKIELGMSILCSISATKVNITVLSVPYFAGFEITSNSPLQLQYTEEELVHIRLTVPFGCQRQHEECFLGVNMFYMETGADNCLLPVAAALSSCGVRISSWRWNQSYALRLALKHGQNLNNISRIYNIRFKTDEQFDHVFFRNYTLPRDIQVVATSDTSSLNGKECHAICDPHMQTFDGRYYENQNEGTYILYKHLKIPVQVQMRTNPCYGFMEGPPFCPCGVAIAAGKDVFVIDRCSIPIMIYMPQCDEGILRGKIKSDGNFYQIYLPSGAWIKITSGISFNVYIYPSMSDRMATSGLCGFLDSAVDNDFMLRNGTAVPEGNFEDFNSNWLVQPEEDLFNTSNYFSLPRWPREDLYCICEEYQNGRVFQSGNCSPDSRKFCPESAPNDSLAADCNRKLSTNINVSIQLDPSDFNVSKIRNDTMMPKENFTEDSANYKCWSYLNSSLLFKKCSEVPDIVPESFANTCTKDALIAQTMFWAPTHLDNAQRKCIYQVTVNQPLPAHIREKYNVTLNPGEQASNSSTNKTDVYTSDFLQEVKDMACLMNCTDQGDCIKGKLYIIICICYLHVKRNQTKIHDKLVYMIVEAKWISLAEISCPILGIRSKRSVELPDDPDTIATVYSVAVGNNREIFGSHISLLIIDSLCVDCSKDRFDIACTLKDGFDLINERCVERTSAGKEPDSGSTVLIVSTALGSTLVVIVAGVILHYCFVLRRRRAKYDKETREAAYAQLQEMEARKENYSNVEEIYDEITGLPDDYVTPQDITHAVDESEDGKGSYEKICNANTNMSEGYSYLNTLITNECELNAREQDETEQIASTEEKNIHSSPDDDHSNTDEVVRL
ncbi:hypothetical protein ACJMK2_029697, partial [Sinanodonta woodiana]